MTLALGTMIFGPGLEAVNPPEMLQDLDAFEKNIIATGRAIREKMRKSQLSPWSVRIEEIRTVVLFLQGSVEELSVPNTVEQILLPSKISATNRTYLSSLFTEVLLRPIEPNMQELHALMKVIGLATAGNALPIQGMFRDLVATTHNEFGQYERHDLVILPTRRWTPFAHLNKMLAEEIYSIALVDYDHDSGHIESLLMSDERFFETLLRLSAQPGPLPLPVRRSISIDKAASYSAFHYYVKTLETNWQHPVSYSAFAKSADLVWWYMNLDQAYMDHPAKLLIERLRWKPRRGRLDAEFSVSDWASIKFSVEDRILGMKPQQDEVNLGSYGIETEEQRITVLKLVAGAYLEWLPTAIGSSQLLAHLNGAPFFVPEADCGRLSTQVFFVGPTQ